MEHPSSRIFHAWFPRSSRIKAEKSCSSSTDSKMMGIEFVSPLNPKGFYRILKRQNNRNSVLSHILITYNPMQINMLNYIFIICLCILYTVYTCSFVLANDSDSKDSSRCSVLWQSWWQNAPFPCCGAESDRQR